MSGRAGRSTSCPPTARPETNAALRRRSNGVSEFSQHMRGKAMDFSLPDASMARVREAGVRLQRGGVGFYPGVLQRLRPSRRRQRARLAAHLPRPARPHLPGRQDRPPPDRRPALRPATRRPGPRSWPAAAASPATRARVAEEAVPGGGKSLWARLFGSDEDDDAALANAARARRHAGRRGPAAPRRRTRPARRRDRLRAEPREREQDVLAFFATGSGSRRRRPRSRRSRPLRPAGDAGSRGRGVRRGDGGRAPGGRAASAEAAERSWRPRRGGRRLPPRPRPIEVASAGDMPLFASFAPRPPPVAARRAGLPGRDPPTCDHTSAPRRSGDEERGQLKALFAATGASAPRRRGRRRSRPPAPRRSRSTVASLLTADAAVLRSASRRRPRTTCPRTASAARRQAAARPALTAAGVRARPGGPSRRRRRPRCGRPSRPRSSLSRRTGDRGSRTSLRPPKHRGCGASPRRFRGS